MQLVFFDLDGTISRRDTLTPYVLQLALRRPWRLLRAGWILPTLLAFALRAADHGALKGSLIRALLGGLRREEIEAWNTRFVPHLLQTGLFADARAAIAAHQRAGDRLVLMSASVDLYVPALAEALGFDECICSKVVWQGDRLIGELQGDNCRDQVKLVRFRERAAQNPDAATVAYGNSRPDLPHLRVANRAVLVNPTGKLQTEATAAAIECVRWS